MNMFFYLALINALTFFFYWFDKRAARRHGMRRVPEATLLMAGFLGGTPAALVGHKTRKTSFQIKFWAVTFVQLGLLLFPPDVLRLILSRAF